MALLLLMNAEVVVDAAAAAAGETAAAVMIDAGLADVMDPAGIVVMVADGARLVVAEAPAVIWN